jgi:hypothetical protein
MTILLVIGMIVVLYINYCSRNNKKVLLQKSEFLKRHPLINLLNPHLKTPSCRCDSKPSGRGWKVRLPKVEKEDSHEWFNPKDKSIALQQELSKWNRDAEPSSAWQEERNHHFCHPEPGPELNSGSNDFGISVLSLENLGFKTPPCGRSSLLYP